MKSAAHATSPLPITPPKLSLGRLVALLVFLGLLAVFVVSVVVFNYAQQHTTVTAPPVQETLPAVASDITVDSLLLATNAERMKAGLPALQGDSLLNMSARRKADEMVKLRCYEHVCNGRQGYEFIKEAYPIGTKVGENLSRGRIKTADVVSSWMSSKSHREAILDPSYKFVGFGVSHDDIEDKYYVVQHFYAP